VEIPEFYAMVEELFTPQEAEVNNAMPRKPFSAAELAGEMNRDESEIKTTHFSSLDGRRLRGG